VANEFYVSITGSKQGKFKPEGAPKPYQEKIAGTDFNQTVAVPRDFNTGQPTGKRQYSPIVFKKNWGAASAQLFQALVKNEMLTSVLFEFIHRRPDGGEAVYQTIKLTNAFVQYIHRFTPGDHQSGLEEVGLIFGKFEVEDKEAKTMAEDNWEG
jgi:type VI secretion system secreted protein Hcp